MVRTNSVDVDSMEYGAFVVHMRDTLHKRVSFRAHRAGQETSSSVVSKQVQCALTYFL